MIIIRDAPLSGDLPFDPDAFPYGKRAGDNKFDLRRCPFCKNEGFQLSAEQSPSGKEDHFFCFRDVLSAREYYISGLCQSCQDSTFGAH